MIVRSVSVLDWNLVEKILVSQRLEHLEGSKSFVIQHIHIPPIPDLVSH